MVWLIQIKVSEMNRLEGCLLEKMTSGQTSQLRAPPEVRQKLVVIESPHAMTACGLEHIDALQATNDL